MSLLEAKSKVFKIQQHLLEELSRTLNTAIEYNQFVEGCYDIATYNTRDQLLVSLIKQAKKHRMQTAVASHVIYYCLDQLSDNFGKLNLLAMDVFERNIDIFSDQKKLGSLNSIFFLINVNIKYIELTKQLGVYYLEAYDIANKILLLEDYQRSFTEAVVKCDNNFSLGSFKHILSLKKLMYETRYQHFSRYRQKQSFPIVNLELLKRFNPSQALSSKQWLHELRLEEARLQRQHHHFMQDLAKKLDWKQNYTSALARFWLQSTYYRSAETIIKSLDRITHTGLDEEYLNLTVIIFSMMMVYFEFQGASLLRQPIFWGYSLIKGVSRQKDTVLYLADQLNLNIFKVINNLDLVCGVCSMALAAAFSAVISGLNWSYMAFYCGSIVFVYAVQSLLQYTAKSCLNSSFNVAFGLVNYAVIYFGLYFWQKIYTQISAWQATQQDENLDEILANEVKCKARFEVCKNQALKTLGLSENATLADIKRRWRSLVLAYHPDKSVLSQEESAKVLNSLMQARKRLHELISEKLEEGNAEPIGNSMRPLLLGT